MWKTPARPRSKTKQRTSGPAELCITWNLRKKHLHKVQIQHKGINSTGDILITDTKECLGRTWFKGLWFSGSHWIRSCISRVSRSNTHHRVEHRNPAMTVGFKNNKKKRRWLFLISLPIFAKLSNTFKDIYNISIVWCFRWQLQYSFVNKSETLPKNISFHCCSERVDGRKRVSGEERGGGNETEDKDTHHSLQGDAWG